MNLTVFNACLLGGWLMFVAGLCAWSFPIGMAAGGAVLMAVTLFIGLRAGVKLPPNREKEPTHVSHE